MFSSAWTCPLIPTRSHLLLSITGPKINDLYFNYLEIMLAKSFKVELIFR